MNMLVCGRVGCQIRAYIKYINDAVYYCGLNKCGSAEANGKHKQHYYKIR